MSVRLGTGVSILSRVFGINHILQYAVHRTNNKIPTRVNNNIIWTVGLFIPVGIWRVVRILFFISTSGFWRPVMGTSTESAPFFGIGKKRQTEAL